MQGTHDNGPTEVPDSDQPLDPRQAALLMDHSTREARRQFDPRPPAFMVLMAVVVLAAYVVLWLSSKGQHPYRGPSPAAIGLIYGVVAVTAILAARLYRRATAGVGGASLRQQRIDGIARGLSVCGSPLIQGAMYRYHASDTIVYGVIPAAGPLIIIGTTLVGIASTKADWPGFGAALVVVIAGIVALFVGPSGAWLAAGIGIFIAIVGFAIARAQWHSGQEARWALTPSIR
jgi:hypothetical protein